MAFCYVCVVGPKALVPRKLGDNLGGWPVRVVVTEQDWRKAPTLFNHWPYADVGVLWHFSVRTRERGEQIREALHKAMAGCADFEGLDKGWRDVGDPSVVIPILIEDVVRQLDFDALNDKDREAAIQKAERRRMARARV